LTTNSNLGLLGGCGPRYQILLPPNNRPILG
jgi:hypothetical protein